MREDVPTGAPHYGARPVIAPAEHAPRSPTGLCLRRRSLPLHYRASQRAWGKPMRIHNLYVDAKGETHFRDIEVKWVEEKPGGKLSKRLPATGIIFREPAGDYALDW